MKNKVVLIIVFLVITNLIFSTSISISGILNRNYFNDYYNYKSLKNPEKFMEIDSLIFRTAKDYTYTNNSPNLLIIYGSLLSNNSKIKMAIGSEKYFNYNLDKHPIYSSKITNDNFLKDAPDEYYRRQYRSFIMTMYLKISLIPLLVLLVFLFKKYRN